jgi:ribonucleotide reductase alpha subunit
MRIERRYTKDGQQTQDAAYAGLKFRLTTSEIKNPDGKQVFDRLAGTWTYWGWKGGYFDSEADARAFYDELRTCWRADGAPNSPQWFNTGLHWAYGIDGPARAIIMSIRTGRLTKSKRL